MEANRQEISTVHERQQGWVARALEPVSKPEFWGTLFKHMLHEAVSAFFVALGGTLVWYGRTHANKDIQKNTPVTPINTSGPAQAFSGNSGSYAPPPTPMYQQHTPTYPIATSRGDDRFPGFGR